MIFYRYYVIMLISVSQSYWTSSAHLLRPEALQFLLEPRAEPLLQHFPLLARCLELSKSALHALHLRYVRRLLLQILLKLQVAELGRGQLLFQQRPSLSALVAGDSKVLNFPLQLLSLSLLLRL